MIRKLIAASLLTAVAATATAMPEREKSSSLTKQSLAESYQGSPPPPVENVQIVPAPTDAYRERLQQYLTEFKETGAAALDLLANGHGTPLDPEEMGEVFRGAQGFQVLHYLSHDTEKKDSYYRIGVAGPLTCSELIQQSPQPTTTIPGNCLILTTMPQRKKVNEEGKRDFFSMSYLIHPEQGVISVKFSAAHEERPAIYEQTPITLQQTLADSSKDARSVFFHSLSFGATAFKDLVYKLNETQP